MKNIYIIAAFFFCLHASAQNADTAIVIDPKEDKTPASQQSKSYDDLLLKHKNFQSEDTQFEFVQKTVRVIDVTEKNVTVTLMAAAISPLETDSKKRLVTGPSQYDSRIELRQLNPLSDWQKKILDRSVSVGIIIEKSMMHKITDSLYQLDISTSIGKLYNLCPDEAFYDQPAVGIGTAFIIDEKTMLTAGHVFNGALSNYAIIFGFEMINKAGAYEAFIPAKDIYYPNVVTYNSDELDVTMFNVNRTFDRPVLTWSASSLNPLNTSVYMIGHPMGIPKKIALNASIQSNDNSVYFYTSLDAFQGNSGSPVFRLDTHEVIGILVSGEIDYKWNGNCNGFTICSIPFCKGEKVIRIEQIMNAINNPLGN